jgi:hypothetical protein
MSVLLFALLILLMLPFCESLILPIHIVDWLHFPLWFFVTLVLFALSWFMRD